MRSLASVEKVVRVRCEVSAECPGEFFVPSWVGGAICPVCGSYLHPENNGRNGGPRLFDAETHEEWSPEDVADDAAVTDGK